MSPSDHVLRYLALLGEPLPPDPLARRDAEFIHAELDVLGRATDAWFAPDVLGLEQLPDGPSLVVGTHNGGTLAPDMFALMVAFWRRFGTERPAYGLAHDLAFRVPIGGRWLGKLGAVPAHQHHARALLERGATVLVYPGGEIDAFKPHRERHQVKFGERSGFVRTALAAQVPIVPVVSVGAHETFLVVTDGREIARRLGLRRLLRIEVMPVMLCLPWGVAFSAWEAHLPAPSKLRIRMLPPMRFDYPASAASDDAVVRSVREEVRRAMQTALDELVAEGGFGVGVRLSASLSSRVV